MSGSRGLAQKDKAHLRRLFTGADNLDQLQYLICLYVQEFVFPTCPSADPADLKLVLIRRLSQELRTAIIKKLKDYYPKDAHRNEGILLRYYPDRSIDLLQQALGHLVDIWTEDQRTHKRDVDDTLVKKCQRVLPMCADLPDLRGRSALGNTSRLFSLVVYEDVKLLLQNLPPTPNILTNDHRKQRLELFFRILNALQRHQTGLTPLPPLCVADVFASAAQTNFEDWLQMSRSDIALDVVAKTTGQRPDYFVRTLKKLRAEADLLEVTPLKPVL